MMPVYSRTLVSLLPLIAHAVALHGSPPSAELIPHGTLRLAQPASTFSLLSWNILLPNGEDNWWCEKMYQPHVPHDCRQWSHRQRLIRDRLLLADADIVCVQEAAGNTFASDFEFLHADGYESVLHKKFRFRCATLYRPSVFKLLSVAHEDRALVAKFASASDPSLALFLANVHLSGGASPDRRLRQVHGVTERVRKWVAADAKKPPPKGRRGSAARRAKEASEAEAAASNSEASPPRVIITGDFNSDGNTAVRRLLVDGSVEPEWREPQFNEVELTSKPRRHGLGAFADAGEVAYAQNVCDGDWGDWGGRIDYAHYRERRPATYVVPSLGAAFLERSRRSTSRQQLVADNEMLERLVRSQEGRAPPVAPPRSLSAADLALCDATAGADAPFVAACRRAFDAIDADRGGSLSAAELRQALALLSVLGPNGEEPSAADADAMLSAADTDSSGEVAPAREREESLTPRPHWARWAERSRDEPSRGGGLTVPHAG